MHDHIIVIWKKFRESSARYDDTSSLCLWVIGRRIENGDYQSIIRDKNIIKYIIGTIRYLL